MLPFECGCGHLVTPAPTLVHGLDVRVGFNDPPLVWIGGDRVGVIAWDSNAEKSGDLYFRILRGRNVADQWKRSFDAQSPSVSVLDSGRPVRDTVPSARLVAFDVRTKVSVTLAHGAIHLLTVSPDQRFISFLRAQPEFPSHLSPLFEPDANAESGYAAVNWGTERRVIDARSGKEISQSHEEEQREKPVPKPDSTVMLPRPGARWLSASPNGSSAISSANTTDGTHLWLCGRSTTQSPVCAEIWRANEWIKEIKRGGVEAISYVTTDGKPLTAWLLLPPDYEPGIKLPVITIVYPGTVYGATEPSSLSAYRTDFEHPQLFASLGYGVLLPSMPPPKDPMDSHALGSLASGVLPALDAVVARGFADPDRIALLGQSAGGFATLGLITQTTRFRTAIASAGYSDLVSLYGTFYGQYRYGDAGLPQKGQVLRMLQMEKGFMGLGKPPWLEADRYRDNSSILLADKVQTPLMLVHGDLDFVPIQQAEEFFSALYRQDKRAEFVRYRGEWHTISNRANVLDLWKRVTDWLFETMSVRK